MFAHLFNTHPTILRNNKLLKKLKNYQTLHMLQKALFRGNKFQSELSLAECAVGN